MPALPLLRRQQQHARNTPPNRTAHTGIADPGKEATLSTLLQLALSPVGNQSRVNYCSTANGPAIDVWEAAR